eukprot:14094922-Alexandrium_andersonii.AAC.1
MRPRGDEVPHHALHPAVGVGVLRQRAGARIVSYIIGIVAVVFCVFLCVKGFEGHLDCLRTDVSS